jgi:hypothetical protein
MLTPALDDSPPKRRTGFAVTVIYAAFLSALLYLFFSQAGDDAPTRMRASSLQPLVDLEKQLKSVDQQNPAPAEFSVIMPQGFTGGSDAGQTAGIYYMAQYIRYPHRLLVGMDDKIINEPGQLLSVPVPSTAWMLQHDVRQIYYVLQQMGPHLLVRPVQ